MASNKKRMSKRNKIRLKSILLLVFLFGLNTLAWFIYISKVNTDLRASVVSWDVTFMDNNNIVEAITLEITDMKPGMPNFSKTYTVRNRSGVDAHFEYTIKKVTLFGVEYTSSTTPTADEVLTMLQTQTPYVLTLNSSTETIAEGSTATFDITLTWPYEPTNSYVRINGLYEYQSGYTYYVKNGNDYVMTVATSTNYNSLVESGLYMEGNDADTYWGEKSARFKAQGGENSLVINMDLEVKQIGESQSQSQAP